jgi:hypothetical protein
VLEQQDKTAIDRVGYFARLSSSRLGRTFVATVILAIFAFGHGWEARGHVSDVHAATLPAWHFVENGSWDLSEYADLNPWFVETESGVFSMRTPGILGVAVVGYFLTSPFTDGFYDWPGIVTAIIAAWLSVLLVAASAERLGKGTWLPAAILFGLGTATWAVSADQLWPHGPAQLAIAAGLYLMIRGRDTWAGVCLGFAVLVRPVTIILGLGMAVTKAVTSRSLRPLMTIGLPTVVGGVAYLAFNRILFGSFSPMAAYESVGGLIGLEGIGGVIGNQVSALIGLQHGVLVWSSWLLVCALFGLRWIKGTVPNWLWLTPLVALIYVLVHSSMEIASGAMFYNYRYPLEAVALAAPVLVATLPKLEVTNRHKLIFAGAAAASISLQVCAVLVARCWIPAGGEFACSLFG